jgi:hypothetical protein
MFEPGDIIVYYRGDVIPVTALFVVFGRFTTEEGTVF